MNSELEKTISQMEKVDFVPLVALIRDKDIRMKQETDNIYNKLEGIGFSKLSKDKIRITVEMPYKKQNDIIIMRLKTSIEKSTGDIRSKLSKRNLTDAAYNSLIKEHEFIIKTAESVIKELYPTNKSLLKVIDKVNYVKHDFNNFVDSIISEAKKVATKGVFLKKKNRREAIMVLLNFCDKISKNKDVPSYDKKAIIQGYIIKNENAFGIRDLEPGLKEIIKLSGDKATRFINEQKYDKFIDEGKRFKLK